MAEGALQGERLVAWPYVGVAHPPGPWPYDRYVHEKHLKQKSESTTVWQKTAQQRVPQVG